MAVPSAINTEAGRFIGLTLAQNSNIAVFYRASPDHPFVNILSTRLGKIDLQMDHLVKAAQLIDSAQKELDLIASTESKTTNSKQYTILCITGSTSFNINVDPYGRLTHASINSVSEVDMPSLLWDDLSSVLRERLIQSSSAQSK